MNAHADVSASLLFQLGCCPVSVHKNAVSEYYKPLRSSSLIRLQVVRLQ